MHALQTVQALHRTGNYRNNLSCESQQREGVVLLLVSFQLKVVGSGHSPSDIACTNGYMISLENYARILSIDPKTNIVSVQSGVTLATLNEASIMGVFFALTCLGAPPSRTCDAQLGLHISANNFRGHGYRNAWLRNGVWYYFDLCGKHETSSGYWRGLDVSCS
jgi:hypothetical protein